VTINGYTYRSTVATMGGEFMLPVSAEVREHAGVAADEVDVDVELDTEAGRRRTSRTLRPPPSLSLVLLPPRVRYFKGSSPCRRPSR